MMDVDKTSSDSVVSPWSPVFSVLLRSTSKKSVRCFNICFIHVNVNKEVVCLLNSNALKIVEFGKIHDLV